MKHKIWVRRRDKVRQRYWKSYSTTPLDTSDIITLYHGTSSKAAKKIMREGLKPAAQPYDDEMEAYLTFRPRVALQHARIGSEQEYAKNWEPGEKLDPIGTGSVLKITIPKSQLPLGVNQKIWSRKEIMTNPSISYQLRINKLIPAKYIKIVPYNKLLHKSHAIEQRMERERDKDEI